MLEQDDLVIRQGTVYALKGERLIEVGVISTGLMTLENDTRDCDPRPESDDSMAAKIVRQRIMLEFRIQCVGERSATAIATAIQVR